MGNADAVAGNRRACPADVLRLHRPAVVRVLRKARHGRRCSRHADRALASHDVGRGLARRGRGGRRRPTERRRGRARRRRRHPGHHARRVGNANDVAGDRRACSAGILRLHRPAVVRALRKAADGDRGGRHGERAQAGHDIGDAGRGARCADRARAGHDVGGGRALRGRGGRRRPAERRRGRARRRRRQAGHHARRVGNADAVAGNRRARTAGVLRLHRPAVVRVLQKPGDRRGGSGHGDGPAAGHGVGVNRSARGRGRPGQGGRGGSGGGRRHAGHRPGDCLGRRRNLGSGPCPRRVLRPQLETVGRAVGQPRHAVRGRARIAAGDVRP